MTQDFRITKTDIRAAIKAYNPNRTLKSGLQTIINHISGTLKKDSEEVVSIKGGEKKVFHYSYSHPQFNSTMGFAVVVYPSGNVSINNQPVVIGDKVAQLARMFKLADISA